MTDTRTLIGRLGVQAPLSARPAAEIRPFVARIAALGYSALWVGDGAAHDPFALLAAVTEAAGPMVLGTNIVNVYGRDAMATKMGAMSLHELTGGRFVLGLGVSHDHLVEDLRGHRYGPPVTKMREYLGQYGSLSYKGPTVDDASGEPTAPPLLLAALRSRMTQLSATDADGALPYFVSVARVAMMRQVLDDAAPADGPRPILAVAMPVMLETDAVTARAVARGFSQTYCRAVNYQKNLAEQGYDEADWTQPYSDRLMDDIIAWGDAAEIRARLEAMYGAGADHVMALPIDATGGTDHLSVLEAIAPSA